MLDAVERAEVRDDAVEPCRARRARRETTARSSSPHGSTVARSSSPARASRRSVRLTISSDGSQATTRTPREARNAVSTPVPQPISSTREPAREATRADAMRACAQQLEDLAAGERVVVRREPIERERSRPRGVRFTRRSRDTRSTTGADRRSPADGWPTETPGRALVDRRASRARCATTRTARARARPRADRLAPPVGVARQSRQSQRSAPRCRADRRSRRRRRQSRRATSVFAVITGVPHAIASTTGSPKPS